MSIRRLVIEYVLRNNDLSIAADRCHSIISNAGLPPTTRCEVAYDCARSLISLVTTASDKLYEEVVKKVDKCVAERAKGSSDKCELARAYISCVKSETLGVVLYYIGSLRGETLEEYG